MVEIHDTHHPVTSWLYFEEQIPSAKRRTKDFWRYRVPKFLGYFEKVLARSGGPYLLGRRLSYVDLSLFQIVEGLRYAFPKRMKRFEKKMPRRDRAARPRREAPAHRRLSRIGAAHPVQPVGHLPLLQAAGCLSGLTDAWSKNLEKRPHAKSVFREPRVVARYPAPATGTRRVSRQNRNSPDPITIAEPISRPTVGMSPQIAKPSSIAQTSCRYWNGTTAEAGARWIARVHRYCAAPLPTPLRDHDQRIEAGRHDEAERQRQRVDRPSAA